MLVKRMVATSASRKIFGIALLTGQVLFAERLDITQFSHGDFNESVVIDLDQRIILVDGHEVILSLLPEGFIEEIDVDGVNNFVENGYFKFERLDERNTVARLGFCLDGGANYYDTCRAKRGDELVQDQRQCKAENKGDPTGEKLCNKVADSTFEYNTAKICGEPSNARENTTTVQGTVGVAGTTTTTKSTDGTSYEPTAKEKVAELKEEVDKDKADYNRHKDPAPVVNAKTFDDSKENASTTKEEKKS
jgi:hypothetical protein